MDYDFGFFQQLPKGDQMSNTKNQNESSLLWDCFTNWSLTLEKTTDQKVSAKKAQTE